MFELPLGWTLAQLGDLIDRVEAGLNVRCEERAPDQGEVGLVKISAVTWGQFDELQSKTLPADSAPDERLRIRPGDLLISRANTVELVGACVVVGSITRDLYLSDKVLRLVAGHSIRPWINYALKTPESRKRIADASSGNQLSMRNITQAALRALPVPLAPPSEQQRIVSKLNALLGRVDGCRERLERVGPLIKRFRQAVLAAATSGALSADWRASSKAPAWQYAELGDVADVGTGSTPLRSVDGYFAPSGTPWVTSAATSAMSVTSAVEFVTAEAIRAHRLKVYPAGTLLVAMYGEGKTRGQVSELAISAAINQACAAISVAAERATKDFVKLTLQANYVTMRAMAGGGNQPNLNLSKIRSVALSLPSPPEQAEIVRRVGRLFAFADQIEARLANAKRAAAALTPATLAKAFRGELVPQDPNDEPADVLLARIRAEREAAAVAAPRRRRAPSTTA